MPQTCSKLAASLRLIVAASLLQTRFSYANFFSGALFWHTMCAASMQHTVVAHCSGTQCAPQVCSTQLSRTVLAHNVHRKYAVHSCRALFWHTMWAASLQRTVVAHYSCVPQVCSTVAVHCAVLLCARSVPLAAHFCTLFLSFSGALNSVLQVCGKLAANFSLW